MRQLEVRDLKAGYSRDIDILSGLSVTARPSQLTTIIGANGVGKSTLLKTIIGQLAVREGSIRYGERDLAGVATRELVSIGIAYVPQGHALFKDMTVAENIEIATWSFRSDKERARRARRRLFERAPYLEDFRQRRAGLMSGGQQRLMQLELALMSDPELILIDEPTVGLDPKRAEVIYTHLRQLVKDEGRTILMVDQNVIAGTEVADYIYVLELGSNKLEGTRAEFDETYRDTIADWLF
ncbi:putative branched-chain amino acid transport ATP-binding ABC transporter [Fulvimarina pelagi HTCC2506]|uniref:Putative branched-chain amino acid transport ATP-binding ABC transporter n=1 Tax=Fulvimarina pelagi HTCC2506 TaxID=314231 RepID=Q0FY59_9HYPH|nr:ATP-binding cassette domain-containing protein [Fulvimarina pelagi]EAU39883.1 putative branched-chain amino acid transport ATP-binding ABC transporter [Fulvimarina pelagi HTCC2506]